MKLFLYGVLSLMAVAIGTAVGCGSPFTLAKVSGKVTLKGRPVTQGTVLFRPAKGPVAAGVLGSGGSYTLTSLSPGDGAIVGECAMAISAPRFGLPPPGQPIPKPPPPEETILKKFHEFATSGLARTVEDKDNVFDFELSEL